MTVLVVATEQFSKSVLKQILAPEYSCAHYSLLHEPTADTVNLWVEDKHIVHGRSHGSTTTSEYQQEPHRYQPLSLVLRHPIRLDTSITTGQRWCKTRSGTGRGDTATSVLTVAPCSRDDMSADDVRKASCSEQLVLSDMRARLAPRISRELELSLCEGIIGAELRFLPFPTVPKYSP